ncbi:hypothetical protein L1987_53900 [Smallanthus sonchifolius]|uniref:Uncharacterized protein n=2 Tax=Smallanthus sonchifolius TaxID=185202 RepID=A0ACB9EYD5_9ASTR|nr:hypothetical protein L1987_53896 [Smallanthus sonchifolius]KAI3763439.1 hypothetical protein L1987_53900 [Smallanthus sonchifolius]
MSLPRGQYRFGDMCLPSKALNNLAAFIGTSSNYREHEGRPMLKHVPTDGIKAIKHRPSLMPTTGTSTEGPAHSQPFAVQPCTQPRTPLHLEDQHQAWEIVPLCLLALSIPSSCW